MHVQLQLSFGNTLLFVFSQLQLSFGSTLLFVLVFTCFTQFLILILQTEESLVKDESTETTDRTPSISLSLCSIAFAALTFFVSFNPESIGANPISLAWIIGFAVFWSFSFSFGSVGFIPNFIAFNIFRMSQYSTDERGYWVKFFSQDRQSLALAVISSLVTFLVLFGLLVSSMVMSPIDINRRWRLLLASSLIGIGLGSAAHLGFWIFRSLPIG